MRLHVKMKPDLGGQCRIAVRQSKSVSTQMTGKNHVYLPYPRSVRLQDNHNTPDNQSQHI